MDARSEASLLRRRRLRRLLAAYVGLVVAGWALALAWASVTGSPWAAILLPNPFNLASFAIAVVALLPALALQELIRRS